MVTLDQLPGGDRLATLVAHVDSFQPSAVEAIASSLSSSADRLTSMSAELRGAVYDLATDSAGDAVDQFVTYMGPFDSGMTAMVTAMNETAGLVDQVATDFAAAKSEVGRIVADLLSRVPADYPSAPQGTPAMAQLVDGATGQVQQVLQSRLSGLSKVAGQLRSLAEISPKLSDMRAPDGTPVPSMKPVSDPTLPGDALTYSPTSSQSTQQPQLYGAHPTIHSGHSAVGVATHLVGDTGQSASTGHHGGHGQGGGKGGSRGSLRHWVPVGVAAMGVAAGVVAAAHFGSSTDTSKPDNGHVSAAATPSDDGGASGGGNVSVGGGKTKTLLVTLYGWPDNSPPGSAIAYGKAHNSASGTGTFDDPITFATDKDEIPAGTKIYYPFLKRYFLMEDDCVECDADWKNGKSHIDLWLGGQNGDRSAVLKCEDDLTRTGEIILDPPSDEPVDKTPLFDTGDNKCYGGSSK